MLIGLEGNLVRDPERKYTKDQKEVVSFTLAHSTGKRGVNQHAVFFRCAAWGKFEQEDAARLREKDRVIVDGEFGHYAGKDKSGNAKDVLTIRVLKVRKVAKFEGQAPGAAPAEPVLAPAEDEDVPF